MNIFFLDKSPLLSARYQCDKHVIKMILETAQILSTVKRLYNYNDDGLYKSTHANHPCTKWVYNNYEHYLWLVMHFFYLNLEYNYRFNKNHKSFNLFPLLMQIPSNIPKKEIEFNLKVTDNNNSDVVESYREYYRNKSKVFVMKWTKRNKPYFL
ncbi:pyrimidine dimer DNA glycosylase/endonuclease V [Rickettsiales bacterium LUAb2]